ncbi:MAG: hypothetical protein COU22_03455 [Candidatus Komeilibacteria bacterium CG10_big_fil_rev_8_21_14_0_10_41_13]|uniref:DUF7670 domain-containing protein n=1 Tax=Candidatus Komeilibacteria bacterium CG10_big_fil_rev_8_21_14_0_10_41_13 TaxID=1974476 RepID=A0A2M6WBP0_9BACT|nr:MAG: hypothetical protein COU22_03455 [Candidatus Komeilibacteria bacterium CG10_big_fil_rev_8_21_14_0_10_41_13]
MSKKFVYYFPLYLAILSAAFLSIFALDVFGEGYNLSDLLLALVIHLIPTILYVIVIVIAWKNRTLGGVIFLILGLISLCAFNTYHEFEAFILISLPIILIGSLLLLIKEK